MAAKPHLRLIRGGKRPPVIPARVESAADVVRALYWQPKPSRRYLRLRLVGRD